MANNKPKVDPEAFISRLASLLSEIDDITDDVIEELGDGKDQYFERCFSIIDDWKKRLKRKV